MRFNFSPSQKCFYFLLFLLAFIKLEGQDAFEPNNAFNESKSVALGSTSTATIHQSGDVDYFKVTTTKGGVLIANIPLNNTTLNLRIKIFLENTNNLVANGVASTPGAPVDAEAVLPAGTFFIVIDSYYGGFNNNSYLLNISFDEADKCEWNNTFATACEISPNTTFDATIRGTYSDSDIDYYKVTVTRGGVLSVYIPANPANLTLRARIYANNTSDLLAENVTSNAGGAVLAEAVVPSGTYYIQLSDYYGRLNNNIFKVNVNFDIEDDKEWNNTYTTANSLNNNTSFKAKIRGTFFPLPTDADVDYYKISFTQSSTLKVNIPLNSTNLSLSVKILNESDLKVLANEVSAVPGGPVTTEANVSAGNYLIVITDYYGRTHPNAYTVNIGNPTLPPPTACVLPQVYALTTSSITASSATLNSGISGFSEYEFNHRVVGTLNWTAGTATTGSLSITGLSASTNYEFRVRVKCSDGSFSDWTGNQPFSTLGTGPGNTCALPQVYALATSNLTKTGASLNSGITATGFKNFEFNYRKEGTTTWTPSISANASINIADLTQSTRYEFRVRVQCSNDVWSDWTTSIFFTTLGDVNPPPPGQTQLFISKTQASAGDTALVTIQANNFKDIGGFQFSVSVPSQKARIVGVDQAKSFAGLQMRQVDPYRWGFIWFDPNLVAKTLPDGAVLITLKVVFNVELSPNDCIPITFDNNPTEIAATTLINQNVGEFIPTTTNGELCLVSTATISGTIKNTSGLGINQVRVNIGNGVVYTDGNGKYTLPNLPVTSSYTISPSKTGTPKNGVNVVDIVTIRQHILGDKIFDTPYKYIASDVNFSGSVNVVDVVLIQQLILGQIDSLKRNWVFIPAGHTFATPESAIKNKYPEMVSYSKLPGDLTQDFIGVKIGDANHSASVKNRWQNKPGLQLPPLNLSAGETLEVPVYAWNLEQIQGFQVQLLANPQALQLNGIQLPQGGVLTLNNFDLRSLDQGELKILWVQALSSQVAALPKDQALFYLKIQARANTQLSRELSIKEEDFENLFANQDLDWTSGQLFFNQSLLLKPQTDYGIKHLVLPNPSLGVSPVLQIETAQSGAYQVVITDVMGRVVKIVNANAVPGINRETLLNQSTTAQGLYHYRVLFNGQVLVGKFLLTNGN